MSNVIEKHFLIKITKELLKDYANASGDHNPIHQDEEIAKAMGLPGVIAHGMFVAGLLHQKALEFAENLFTKKVKLKHSKTRFRGMVLLKDELFFTVKVSKLTLECSVLNQKDELMIVSVFSFSEVLA